MIIRFERLLTTFAFLFVSIFLLNGCQNPPSRNASNSSSTATNTAPPPPSSSPSVSNEQKQKEQAVNLPFTLPVLDAMFADEKFPAELKSKLNLTDEQIEQLRQTAKEATANLSEDDANGSTSEAKQHADEKIRALLGEEKALELAKFVSERWEKGSENVDAGKPQMSNANQPNAIPTDTRIVVNAPAFRMDLFKDGQLVKSYKIGIGYPEFPLPGGMREASTIIFNPTWTPPDEPWVKGKVQAGKKIEAGSSLNPLGPIKIPIGSPSLIHGGKSAGKLGTFASHGCVGLTSPQVQNFSLDLAQLSGSKLTAEDIASYAKNKTETKNFQLSAKMPIELRYETIVVENGVLKIYRDVYERGTNTDANLRKVLEAYGVSFDSLSKEEQAKISTAVKQMAVDAGGQTVTEEEVAAKAKVKKNSSQTVTRVIKGKTEIAIPLAALAGKGYPAPIDLNTGTMSGKPYKMPQAKTPEDSNSSAQSNTNQKPSSNANSSNRKF